MSATIAALPRPSKLLLNLGVCIAWGLLYGLSYCLLVSIVRSLGLTPILWPANAAAIVYLLTRKSRSWEPMFFACLTGGMLAANFSLALSWLPAFGFSIAQVAGVAAGVWFYRLWSTAPPRESQPLRACCASSSPPQCWEACPEP